MLNKKEIIAPDRLIDLAKKTSSVPVAIVCAHHESTMNSAKQAWEFSLIKTNLIGILENLKL